MTGIDFIHGRAVPMTRTDIDTDAIIPQRWLITTERSGLGKGLFSNWRYLAGSEEPDPGFILNKPEFAGPRILVAGANYGCGSSREHAVWAHLDYGIKAVISSSFGAIFRDNAFKNGLLPVELPEVVVAELLEQLASRARLMTIDLVRCQVSAPDGKMHRFVVDPTRRAALLEGLDGIGSTLQHAKRIREFQKSDRLSHPWVWTNTWGG